MVYLKYLDKCQPIRMVLADVDGVLTDAGLYCGEKGEELKKFNLRDEAGAILLKHAGIHVGAITGERTQSVHRGVAQLGFDFLYYGIQNKGIVLDRILEDFSVERSQIAYIGDELSDLSLIGRVGLFLTVLDGNPILRKEADCVLKVRGGEGVLREAATMILQAKGCFEATLEKILTDQNEQEESLPLIQKYLRLGREKTEDSTNPE